MNETAEVKRKVALINAVPNLFWSIISFAPVCYFCYKFMDLKVILILAGVSLLAIVLPNSFYNYMQIGKSTKIYKRLGVGFVNNFTQNGSIINNFIKRKYPNYQVVSPGIKSINNILNQTYIFEKFHFKLFLFFSFVAVYSIIEGYYGWALLITATNVIYNIYPCFLQQYIRIRLRLFMRKQNEYY